MVWIDKQHNFIEEIYFPYNVCHENKERHILSHNSNNCRNKKMLRQKCKSFRFKQPLKKLSWLALRQEKMLQHQKCTFREKGPKSWKHISTFLDNLLKEKLVELQWYLNSFWKPEISVMYVSMFDCFSWHKVIIWSIKNQCFLKFNSVLLIIKLAQVLEILCLRLC